MSIIQGIIASNSNIGLVTDPGGGQVSIPNATAGLFRRKANGESSGDNPTWFDLNQGLVTSQYNTTTFIGTDIQDTSATFSLEFRGYFCPTTTANYTFRTTSDDGSWLWIGIPATDPTTSNANVSNGGAHGNITVSSIRAVRLTAGIYYPIRVLMWDSGGGWLLTTEYSTNGGLAWSDDFSGQIWYNSVTNGF